MDGMMCPRLAGFLRLTQRIKDRIQKKKEGRGKDLCPICGCKSNKGNLCQACFMRSFTPIAYTRNIKVVEQNEFYYGPGKKRQWRCKKRAGSTSRQYEGSNAIEKDILTFVMASTDTPGSSEDAGEAGSNTNEEQGPMGSNQPNISTDISQMPFVKLEQNYKAVDIVSSSELVRVDLDEDVNCETPTQQKTAEPLPKFVPDFWESPSEDDGVSHSMAFKLKTFTDHVFKEAQRPFKEIFCDSNTNVFTSTNENARRNEEFVNIMAEWNRGTILEASNSNPPGGECCQHVDTETQCVPADDPNQHVTLSKHLKQKAILELLKVAFKTNMILNNLHHYFKKVVESEGSNSDAHSEFDHELQLDDRIAADSKISVDSFFFPNRQSAILWGAHSNKEKGVSTPMVDEAANFITDEGCKSDTEVISKSQATLSMLMHPNFGFPFEDLTSDEDEPKDDINKAGHNENVSLAPNAWGRLPTRKSHSEDSKLKVKDHPDSVASADDFSEGWESSDLGRQQSSVVAGNPKGEEGIQAGGNSSFTHGASSVTGSDQSGKSLLDLVFGLNRTCIKPSLVPLPDCQQDLITLSSPEPSKEALLPGKGTRRDAVSQTTLSSRHLEQEMNLLHKAFLDQLAHFSVQLVESCKTFGHSWQTSFLAELVEHFRIACNIISSAIGESSNLALPSSDRLDELQDVSNQISICLAKLHAHPHSFIGDCSDHDISTLLSSPPDHTDLTLVNTWV